MAGDLDIVGSAGVDVVPVVPQFHTRLKAAVMPAADRVGQEVGQRMGDAISRHIVISIPDAVTQGGTRARAVAVREGGQVGGAFGRSVKAKLEEAFRSLPRADVRLGDTGINADIDRLRARIASLSNKTIGIDLDAGVALAEITDISARLERLGAQHPSIQVRTDTAAARAALAAVQAQINDVDRDDVNIRVKADTSGAISELKFLGIALGAVAALPVIPVAAAGIGSIAAAAVAAGAGVGALALVAVPAIKSVTSAMQAKTAAEKASTSATNNSAASNVRAAQNALQLAGAQASLTSAHRQAAQAVAQANEQVANAERSLSDAQKSARQAQQDLTAAREDARQQLRAMNDELLDGMLSQKDAELRVKEAAADLAKTLADPKADELTRQRAQLTLDQAKQSLKEQTEKNADLKKSAEAASKAGVEGSDVVKQAKDRLSQANEKVADQERALADARQKVRDAEIQGAEQVAAAQRNLQAAQLSSVDTTARTTSAADSYRAALAKLTPEQRDLYDSIAGPKGLKNAFNAWSTSLQPEVLPLFTRGVSAAKSALPSFTPLVRSAADAVGVLFDKASKELSTPFWHGFKRDLDGAVKPAIIGLGTAFGNVFKGIAGVLDGFLPHTDKISDRLIKTTSRFSKWGTNLKANPEFERFLKFSSDRGAVLADVFGKVATAFLNVGTSLTPISGPLLKVLGGVAEAIGIIAGNAPWLLQGIYAAIVATKLWTLAVLAFNFAMAANPLVLIGIAIVAVVAAVVYAYKKFGWFRDGVQAAWSGIKTATVWLWDNYLKPSFTQLWHILAWVGGKVVWLNDHIVAPVFRAIGAVAKWLYEKAIKPQLSAIWTDVNWLGGKFSWLWTHAISPAVDNIAAGAKWLYEKGVAPAFNNLRSAVRLVADAFGDAKDAIRKHWNQIGAITAVPVNFVISSVYTHGIKAVWDSVAHFVGLKSLPKAPKLLDETPRFATGGQVFGGTPGKDSVRAWLMPGEFVLKTSSARKIGYGALEHLNRTGEIPGYADGGVVGALGSAFDWTKNAVSKGVDWAKTAADLIAHPSKVWERLVKPVLDSVAKGVGSTPLGDALAKLPVRMVDGLKDKLLDAVSGGGSVAGLGDLGAHGASAKQAQSIARAMLPAFGWDPATQMPSLISLWNGESGWRWNALNPSSGAYGIPQSLPASKMASAGPDWRTNPATQIRWGLNYIDDRYGSPSNAYSTWLSRSPRWYDSGGYLPTGLSLVANGTGSPEPVFTGQQWSDLRANAQQRGSVSADGINVYVSTTLDGRELTGHVDKRIEHYDAHSAAALNNGRN
ncbi:aggregation-promoting factor C-terminal-like domain-containing protein [Streptomyces sp. 900105755]